MSKICIIVLCNTLSASDIFNNEIDILLKQCNLKIISELSYNEPLCDKYKKGDYLLFSISDAHYADNCEMFLLPDGCLINGKRNNMPFSERMSIFEKILLNILKKTQLIHLFVGDSGTAFDDYEEKCIDLFEFKDEIMHLNATTPPDLHFTLLQDRGEEKTGDGSLS